MKNQPRKVTGQTIIIILVLMLLGIAQLVICMNPANTFQYSGLAVDSQGRLYLGESLWLGVYENGVRIDKIAVKNTATYYEFTILEDQIHMWDSSRVRKIYSLDGELLDWEQSKRFPLSEKERFEYTTEDGSHYVMKNRLHGRMKVICHQPDGREEVVYRMPLIPYLVQITTPVYFVVIGLWVVKPKWIKKHNKNA